MTVGFNLGLGLYEESLHVLSVSVNSLQIVQCPPTVLKHSHQVNLYMCRAFVGLVACLMCPLLYDTWANVFKIYSTGF